MLVHEHLFYLLELRLSGVYKTRVDSFLKERDIKHKFDSMFSYAVGRNGIEPKLKLKVEPMEGYTSLDLSLEKIVHEIILGPMMASPLAVNSVQRMLQTVGKAALTDRVIASTTPYRPQ